MTNLDPTFLDHCVRRVCETRMFAHPPGAFEQGGRCSFARPVSWNQDSPRVVFWPEGARVDIRTTALSADEAFRFAHRVAQCAEVARDFDRFLSEASA